MNPISMNLDERKTIIAAYPLFAQLQSDDIARLAELMQGYSFSEQETIVKEGAPIDSVYLIASGDAEVTHKITTLEKSMELPISVLHPGDAIGLSDEGFFSKSGLRTATVTALTPMVLLGINVSEFTQFMKVSLNLYPTLKDSAESMLQINFIKNVAPFANMSHEDIDWLLTRIETIDVPTNTIIFKQGNVGDKCYLIKLGKVEIFLEPQHKILAVLAPPAIFGETALITGSPRNATVRTLEDSKLLAIEFKLLKEILKKDEAIARILPETIQNKGIPEKISNPYVFPYQDISGDPCIILKNDNENRYCVIPKAGWFVWEQVNGKNSIGNIIEASTNKFGYDAKDFVYVILKNLANANLIILPKVESNLGITAPSPWSRFLRKIGIIKK